ncbi:threonine/serine exporter ThrE family protein [Quadrisphaera sp. DSM 44207]|uniref:threonine/serine ThrE exporter family protein n=1 Tax=Quadrisphaera sp. DSM 44207 TaxID=1881057 RepID=UPI0008831D2F|nr:threonine/serine exporter family protein [Quadrisphaera sp. DSM 44207]SDQ74318.1 Uncharacterized membrane protein YjjP, DUF1212 family [Quadrisphaera sp. DSM 44207]
MPGADGGRGRRAAGRGAVRRWARRAAVREPQAAAHPPRVRGGLPEAEALQLLQALVRLAEALLSSGASAADVTSTTTRVARGGGLVSSQVDVTYTAVTISTLREDGTPLTVLRMVTSRGTDYGKLAHLYALSRDAGRGLPVDELEARLRRILSAAPLYRRGTAHAATVVLAAALAVQLGGSAAVAAAAAVSAALIQVVLRASEARDLPPFFQQVAGAAAAATVATALHVAQPWLPGALGVLQPSLVVGAGIVVLLAGLSLVGSVSDAIAGYYVTAAARALETLLMSTGLVVGIAGVLDVAQGWGVVLPLLQDPPEGHPLPVALAAAGAASAAWAVSGHAGRRAVALSGLCGALGLGALEVLTAVGVSAPVASAAAALAIGMLAENAGPRLTAPPVVVAICGIVPLLPGLQVYRAILALVTASPAAGVGALLGAAGTALALAAGVSLGAWAAATPQARQRRSRGGRPRSARRA